MIKKKKISFDLNALKTRDIARAKVLKSKSVNERFSR